jgi:hypothetical protein
MKFFETTFVDYIEPSNKLNLHPELDSIFTEFTNNINILPHIILYGEEGIGKYTQSLQLIKRYSPSELKYEKKFIVNFQNKQDYSFKLSDIHFEINMDLLGCNAKILWLQIYQHIQEIISMRTNQTAIILLKNFHNIHSELLDRFYSYMQTILFKPISIKFVILTEQISFIPDNILNICKIVNIRKASKSKYKECFVNFTPKCYEYNNLKKFKFPKFELLDSYNVICSNIYSIIISQENISLLKLREDIYDILTFQLKVEIVCWKIIEKLILENFIKEPDLSHILRKLDTFLIQYNKNYRPIYHIENFFIQLIILINKY